MRLLLLALVLALAACGNEPQQEATALAGNKASGAAAPVAYPTAPNTPVPNTIPVQFLGAWDVEAGTCDPSSDMRLDVAEDRITFYESVGLVQTARDDEGTTMVTLAMEGEGERWTQTLGLRFFDAATSLMVIDPERPGDAEATMRKRCPA